MSKSNQIISGIIIIVAMVVGLFFWYRATIPTASEVNSQTKKIESIQANIVKDPISVQILGMEKNGNVPVEVKAEELGKANPFQ